MSKKSFRHAASVFKTLEKFQKLMILMARDTLLGIPSHTLPYRYREPYHFIDRLIINNAVKCWDRLWQYGSNDPHALPGGRAFCISVQRSGYVLGKEVKAGMQAVQMRAGTP